MLGALAFMAGTAMGLDTQYSWPLWLIAAGAFGLAALARGKGLVRLFALVGLFGLGLVWCSIRVTVPEGFPVPDAYAVQARVRTPIVIGNDGAARFDISNITVITDEGARALPGGAYAWVNSKSAASLQPGDWIELSGSLKLPETARNPGGFDTRRWALTRGDHYSILTDKPVTLLRSDAFSLTRTMRRARGWIASRIDGLFGGGAPLLRAITLGDTDELPGEQRGAFARTGIVHLLAVSGLHVGFLYAFVRLLLDRFDPKPGTRFGMLAALVAAYAVMTGMSPPILRAGLMLLGAEFGFTVSRRADGMTCLSLAAAMILTVSPASIASISFQLSFSALVGITLLYRPLSRLIDRPLKRAPRFIRRALIMTIAAQAGLFVPSLRISGFYPLLSPIANCAAIPLAAAVFHLSIPAIMADAVFHPLAVVIAWPGRALLWLLQVIAEAGAGLGWLLRIPTMIPGVLTAGIYAALFVWSDAVRLRALARAVISGAMLSVGIAVMIAVRLPERYVQLDVGQALSGALHTRSGVIVVDTGRDGSELRDYLHAVGCDIDALFITHGHSDHAGGLLTLLNDPLIKIRGVYVPDADGGDVDPDYESMLEAVRSEGIPIEALSRGDALELAGGTRVDVLWPPSGYYNKDANETSLVMRASAGGNTILFTGDVGLMEPLRGVGSDILQVGHHGSQYSASEAFLEYAAPSVALISCGANNKYLPHPAVLARLDAAGIPYYRTDERGAVTVYLEGERMRVGWFARR